MKQLVGISGHDFWQYVKDTYNLPLSADEYQAVYSVDDEIAAYKNLKPIEGIVNLSKDLQKNHVIIGLATTAGEKRMNAVLDLFSIRNFFNAVTCVNEIQHSKPEPEIYLTTAKKLGVSPNECLVIEDSIRGLKAAKRAGMKCVVYNKDHGVPGKDTMGANLIINDLRVLDYAKLVGL